MGRLQDWQSSMKKCCTNPNSSVTFLYRNQICLDVTQVSGLVFQADTDALLWYRVLSSQHSKFSQPKAKAGFCLIIHQELMPMSTDSYPKVEIYH